MTKLNKIVIAVFTAYFCIMPANLFSQNFQWAKAMGGTSADYGNSIAIDALRNVYTIGYFHGTADFDPGADTFNLTTVGFSDVFISKLDVSGNFVWAIRMGGTDWDGGREVVLDVHGNVYTTGWFEGTVDFDPDTGTFNLTSLTGSPDIFISKLDSSGNFVWAIAMGGTSLDRVNSIALDASGIVYTTGWFQGTADFDPSAGTFNLTSAGLRDIFISKLDSLGNFIWAKRMGGTNNDDSRSIAIDAWGNVYTTGAFQGTADFDPSAATFNLTSAGSADIFISKLDSSGNFVWATQIGGTGLDESHSIAIDAAGNIYTTGKFQETVDFDPGAGTFNLTSAGSDDIFIYKLDASGNFVWAKRVGGTFSDYGSSIVLDTLGNVYTTGMFQKTVDFDPGTATFNLTSAGIDDIFISKLDVSGNFVWAIAMGGTSLDMGNSIALDAMGNVYTTGWFQGTSDFDPSTATFNLTSEGWDDIFVCKLGQSQSNVDAYASAGTSTLTVFPNPVTDILTIEINALTDSNLLWSIADMTGKTIMSGSESLFSGQNFIAIDTKHLANGLYILQSSINGEKIHTKIIKQ